MTHFADFIHRHRFKTAPALALSACCGPAPSGTPRGDGGRAADWRFRLRQKQRPTSHRQIGRIAMRGHPAVNTSN